MDDKEKSVIIGVVSLIYALFIISLGVMSRFLEGADSFVVMVLHLPLLSSGLIGLILKKYWKPQLIILLLTSCFWIVLFSLALLFQ